MASALRYLIFTGEIVMENGSSGTCFLRKIPQKRLKVLFMVSLMCDTTGTGQGPEQNRHTGGKHHERF